MTEFSRPIATDEIDREIKIVKLRADPAECAALAKRFDLLKLHFMTGRLELVYQGNGRFLVAGEVQADVEQISAISAEQMRLTIKSPFSEIFQMINTAVSDAGSTAGSLATEDALLADGVDDLSDIPEIIEDGVIDLGEVLAQHLSLALDPYARENQFENVAHFAAETNLSTSQDVSLTSDDQPLPQDDEPENDARTHPFAKLAALKQTLS